MLRIMLTDRNMTREFSLVITYLSNCECTSPSSSSSSSSSTRINPVLDIGLFQSLPLSSISSHSYPFFFLQPPLWHHRSIYSAVFQRSLFVCLCLQITNLWVHLYGSCLMIWLNQRPFSVAFPSITSTILVWSHILSYSVSQWHANTNPSTARCDCTWVTDKNSETYRIVLEINYYSSVIPFGIHVR